MSPKANSETDPSNTADPDQPDLNHIREGIDRVDRSILELLAERRSLSAAAAEEKQKGQRPFWDQGREEALLADRIQIGRSHHLDGALVARLWKDIIDDSLRLQVEQAQGELNGSQQVVRAAIQGGEGSYSHLAGERFFSARASTVEYVECKSFRDAMRAVEEGRADVVVLPIENTTSGGITEVYDLFLRSDLALVGEINLRVRHCLLGLPDVAVEDLKTVYCHPQAVLQCSEYLVGLDGCEIIYFGDTALSGKRIKELANPSIGAIASEEAARILGLAILQRDIGNRKQNFTRFVVAAGQPIEVAPSIASKTSLIMSVGNEPGALLNTLSVFRDEDINLVKLESRPILNNPKEEMFYLDLDGNITEPRVQKALDQLTGRARFVKVLGSYPCEDLRPVTSQPPQERESMPEEGSRVHAPPAILSTPPQGYRLGSRAHKKEDSVISVGGVRLGAGAPVMIAGPCAVESYDQIMECARVVKEHGGQMLRGGCFKPRTSPYSFQGLGFEGLDMMAEAGKAFGLPIVTEVLAPEHVERMAELADVLQIGTRNMQNFSLLSEVGKTHRPVMLKRGMSSSLDELLQAAEYILAAGNQQVFLCERGIRTFETSTRSTLDLSAVPVLKRRSHLPVIVDPSHAAGDRDLVPPLALAAMAVGADGLMMEIHPDPAQALSDGPQALEFDQFAELMKDLSIR